MVSVSDETWNEWRASLSAEGRASLTSATAPMTSHVTPREPRKQSRRTIKVVGIPKSLLSHQPSGAEKCRLEGRCRMCGRDAEIRQLTQHHVVPLEWWRDIDQPYRSRRNVNANIVPLCRPCHDEVESRDDSVRLPARSMLRHTMSQQEIAFAIACVSLHWLDANYPLVWLEQRSAP